MSRATPTNIPPMEIMVNASLLKSDASKNLYRQMLEWEIQRDKKLGIKAYFLQEADGSFVYHRDATAQPSLQRFNNRLIEQEQWGIAGLNYSLGLRLLIELSELSEEKKNTLDATLENIENNYINRNKQLKNDESPNLLRHSFVCDELIPFMITNNLSIAGKKVKTFDDALRFLDYAKDRTRPYLTPYRIETIKILQHKADVLGTYKRIETPITQFSKEFLNTIEQCRTNNPPNWFQKLSELDQLFLKHDIEACQKGCVLPSQAREKPGMKNVFRSQVFFKKMNENTFRELSCHTHAATSVPMIKGLSDEDSHNLTSIAIQNIKEALKCEHLTVGTLVSQKGDRTLNVADELRYRRPGKYFDARAYRITKETESEEDGISVFNTCMNVFRYGEDDDIEELITRIKSIQQTLSELKDAPENIQHHIQAIRDYADEALLVSEHIKRRVTEANRAINKNIYFPKLIERIVKDKLKDVRKEVRDNLNRYSLRRMAATQINKATNKKDLYTIDGDLKSIRFIWLYTRIINTLSLIKKASDLPVLSNLKEHDIVFGCMSGNNRTEHMSHLMVFFSIMEELSKTNFLEEEFSALKVSILSQLTEDFLSQIITALGGTAGFIGLRAKSKDSTSSHYRDNSHAASLLYFPSSDSKAMDRTLLKLREWVFVCEQRTQGIDNIDTFKEELATLKRAMKENLSLLSFESILAQKRKLPKSFQKQLAVINKECESGIFTKLKPTRHPDWFLLQQLISLIEARRSFERMAKNTLSKLSQAQMDSLELPPIPEVTEAMATRDDLVRLISGKFYYLSLRKGEFKDDNDETKGLILDDDIDNLERHISELRNNYRQHRYSDLNTIRSSLKKPLHAAIDSWSKVIGRKKAHATFYKLCFSLGYRKREDIHYKTNSIEAKNDLECLLTWVNSIEEPQKRKPTASVMLSKSPAITQKSQPRTPTAPTVSQAKTGKKVQKKQEEINIPAYVSAFCYLGTMVYMTGTGIILSGMNVTKPFLSWFSSNHNFACLFAASGICLVIALLFTVVAIDHGKKVKQRKKIIAPNRRFLQGAARTTERSRQKTCKQDQDQEPKQNTTS